MFFNSKQKRLILDSQNNKRLELIMFIMNFINKNVSNLEFMQDKTEEQKKAVEEYISVLRNLIVEELAL